MSKILFTFLLKWGGIWQHWPSDTSCFLHREVRNKVHKVNMDWVWQICRDERSALQRIVRKAIVRQLYCCLVASCCFPFVPTPQTLWGQSLAQSTTERCHLRSWLNREVTSRGCCLPCLEGDGVFLLKKKCLGNCSKPAMEHEGTFLK